MSIGIGENLSDSFSFAKDKLGGNFGNWLVLAVLNIIPILNWIVWGTYVKVLRREAPDLNNMGKSLGDGLLALIITFLYLLIPAIIAFFLGIGSIFAGFGLGMVTMGQSAAGGAGLIGGFVGFLLCIIVFILFSLLLIPALVNFARNGFGAAFSFGTIFGMISKAGWLKYILSIILLWIIFGVIIAICVMLFFIIIGIPILILIMPFLYCWGAKYFANLFE